MFHPALDTLDFPCCVACRYNIDRVLSALEAYTLLTKYLEHLSLEKNVNVI